MITSLMVNDTFRLLKETGICTGDSIWVGGGWQYESGVFLDPYLSVNGCDSLITTILSVDSVIHASFLESICQGDSFFTGGAYQNSGGIYFDTSVSQMGCDSFSVTHLIVYETYSLQIDTGICEGDSILIGNVFSHEAGLYQDMYSSMFGCDSVVMIRLSVEPVPSVFIGNDTIVQAGTELLLDASYPGAAYLWQDGSTGATYIVEEEGLYYVIVTGECGNDQDSINVEYRDFNCNLFMPNAFTPNGDGLNDIFLPKTNCITIEFELIISDRWGRMVFTTNNKDKGWDGMVNNEIAPEGIYSWILSYKAVLYEEVINKKEQGVVVLIR